MEIQIREKCPHCENGIVSSPKWAEFFKADNEIKARTGSYMSNDDFDEWWRNRGYDLKQLPPEEDPCPDCEGNMVIYRWVDIAEVFAVMQQSNKEKENKQ
jgi:hypothetical protein